MQRLNRVFTDPNIVKVLHGADWDIQWLQRDFSIYVVNMFDTGQGQAEKWCGSARWNLRIFACISCFGVMSRLTRVSLFFVCGFLRLFRSGARARLPKEITCVFVGDVL